MAKKKHKLPVADYVGGPSPREQRKYQAEDDVRTLQRAAEIKSDKDRMKYAKECADEQVKALKKVK